MNCELWYYFVSRTYLKNYHFQFLQNVSLSGLFRVTVSIQQVLFKNEYSWVTPLKHKTTLPHSFTTHRTLLKWLIWFIWSGTLQDEWKRKWMTWISAAVSPRMPLVAHLMDDVCLEHILKSLAGKEQILWAVKENSFPHTPGFGSGRLCPAGVRKQIRHGYT